TNPIWEQVRGRQDVFSGAFAYSPNRFNLAMGGEVRNANTSWVSGDFFRTLGVSPLLGRTIADADDRRGCPVIGVLSYDFWQREYGDASLIPALSPRRSRSPWTARAIPHALPWDLPVISLTVSLCDSQNLSGWLLGWPS